MYELQTIDNSCNVIIYNDAFKDIFFHKYRCIFLTYIYNKSVIISTKYIIKSNEYTSNDLYWPQANKTLCIQK